MSSLLRRSIFIPTSQFTPSSLFKSVLYHESFKLWSPAETVRDPCPTTVGGERSRLGLLPLHLEFTFFLVQKSSFWANVCFPYPKKSGKISLRNLTMFYSGVKYIAFVENASKVVNIEEAYLILSKKVSRVTIEDMSYPVSKVRVRMC